MRQCWAPGSSVSKIERDESVSRWLSARMTCLSFHDIVTLSGKHPSSSQITSTEYPTPVDKNNLEWKLSCESWVAFNGNYSHVGQTPQPIHLASIWRKNATNALMYVNTTLVTLVTLLGCHVLQPSRGHLQGELVHFVSPANKMHVQM